MVILAQILSSLTLLIPLIFGSRYFAGIVATLIITPTRACSMQASKACEPCEPEFPKHRIKANHNVHRPTTVEPLLSGHPPLSCHFQSPEGDRLIEFRLYRLTGVILRLTRVLFRLTGALCRLTRMACMARMIHDPCEHASQKSLTINEG